MDEKFLGRILKYDPVNQVLVIKADFIDLDKQKAIEQIIQDNKSFTFKFSKPYKREKTHAQLKKYYKLLFLILAKLEIYPDSDIVQSFDNEIKSNALSCREMIIYDKAIPLIPSKASMSVEEMSILIQYLIETYGELLTDEEKFSDYG